MRVRTKRLARRQRKQFSNMAKDLHWPMIEIDVTKMHELINRGEDDEANLFWKEEIIARAANFVLEENVNNANSDEENHKIINHDGCIGKEKIENNVWVEHTCEACGSRIFRGDRDWFAHVSSKRHKNRVRNLQKVMEGKFGSEHPQRRRNQ